MNAFFLLLPDHFGKDSILFRTAHPLHKAVIATSGYRKEMAHNKHGVLLPVTVNHCILCLCSHFLPVDRRKSRNNSFSIRNRRISYACYATMSLDAESFCGRPFGRGMIPASSLRCLALSRLTSRFTTYLSRRPKYSATSLCVFPAVSIAAISGNNSCTCV